MYVSACPSIDRNKIYVWERRDDGQRHFVVYDAPYSFYVENEQGAFRDIYGKKLELFEFNSAKDFYNTRKSLRENNIKMYESDIQPEYKVLSRYYHNSPVPKLHCSLLDIESDYDPSIGFADPLNPYAQINAISFYHTHTDQMSCLTLLPENGKWSERDISDSLRNVAKITVCRNEKHLLKCFLEEIDDSDIISGWNSDAYDIPYIYNRLEHHKAGWGAELSFKEAPAPRWKETINKFKVETKTLQIFGRSSIDYLQLFKKFEKENRPSYALEAIAEEFLPNLPKLEHEESLHDLYNNNFPEFVRYNIRDSEILKGLESILGYMNLATHFVHDAGGIMENIYGTVKLAELSIINYCHHEMDVKVPDTDINRISPTEKFTGALVLEPQVGQHEWIASLDVESLYPSSIRTCNISPETIVGQFCDKNMAFSEIKSDSDTLLTFIYENGSSKNMSAKDWKKFLLNKNWCISGYGTVFDLNKEGFIPAITSAWFAQRKIHKKKMKEAKKQMRSILEKYAKN